MDNEIDPRIMDNITKVCICKAIPRTKIKDAIRKGADGPSKRQSSWKRMRVSSARVALERVAPASSRPIMPSGSPALERR